MAESLIFISFVRNFGYVSSIGRTSVFCINGVEATSRLPVPAVLISNSGQVCKSLFQKICEPSQNSMRRNGDVKQIPHWGPTTIRRRGKNVDARVRRHRPPSTVHPPHPQIFVSHVGVESQCLWFCYVIYVSTGSVSALYGLYFEYPWFFSTLRSDTLRAAPISTPWLCFSSLISHKLPLPPRTPLFPTNFWSGTQALTFFEPEFYI